MGLSVSKWGRKITSSKTQKRYIICLQYNNVLAVYNIESLCFALSSRRWWESLWTSMDLCRRPTRSSTVWTNSFPRAHPLSLNWNPITGAHHLPYTTVSFSLSFFFLIENKSRIIVLVWKKVNVSVNCSLNGSAKDLFVRLNSSTSGVSVSVCVFSMLCRFFSVDEKRWSSDGLSPLNGSSPHTAHCLTHHLTMFGASLFIHPEALLLLPPVCHLYLKI